MQRPVHIPNHPGRQSGSIPLRFQLVWSQPCNTTVTDTLHGAGCSWSSEPEHLAGSPQLASRALKRALEPTGPMKGHWKTAACDITPTQNPFPPAASCWAPHAFQYFRISFSSSLSSSPVSISLSELGGYSLPYCMGYMQKGFGSMGCRHGLWEEVRGCLVLVPVSSIMDPPQAKAEPISEAGDVPVKTCLRKRRKCQMEGGGGNEVRYKRGTARSEEEEVLHDGADIPCSPLPE